MVKVNGFAMCNGKMATHESTSNIYVRQLSLMWQQKTTRLNARDHPMHW